MRLETERLILRRWREEDFAAFAALNADPVVMEFFPATLTPDQSDAMARHIEGRFDTNGFSFCAVERKGGAPFIGFVGLNVPVESRLPFMPAVEVGWRLAREHWGHGYATEAGRAALAYGFGALGLEEIVAMAVAGNHRSRRVMERIGMRRDPGGDFDDPGVPARDPHARNVLYRVTAPA